MQYLVDGYNLIFTALKTPSTLQAKRENAIQVLSELLAHLNLPILVIFDGARLADEESGYQYFEKFNAFFSPKGQSADDCIIEHVSICKNPKELVVVSSDKALCAHCKSFGASSQSPKAFLLSLEKRHTKKKRESQSREYDDTDANIERLKKVFEKRLNEPD